MPNWVGWRYEWKPKRNGKGDWTKPPVRADNPSQYAKNNDPATWVSYRQAVQAHEAGQCDGIGFNVLNSKFAVLDIDDCRDQSTGHIAPEAMQIVHRAATYCEVSPSGEGLRIIGLGDGPYLQRKLKVPNSKVSVEVYRACERYFTVTGKPLEGGSFPGGLGNIDRLADDLVRELSPPQAEKVVSLERVRAKAVRPDDLPRDLQNLISNPTCPDRSADFHHAVCWLGDLGYSPERIESLIAGQPIVPERYAERLRAQIEACFSKRKPQDSKMTNAVALETRRASSFTLRGIRWLWPDRFALGKLGLIGGLPDKGKGLISIDLIACVTAKRPLPCNEGYTPQGSVLYFTAEDGIEDTVAPRLMAAGADLDRVHIVQMMRGEDGKRRTFNIVTDLPAMRAKIAEIGDVVLVFIDPMSAYLGVGKVNTSMTTDVRGFLKPLTDLAEETSVAIIGIMHFNKKADVTNAMLRIADSLAYVAAARHVYFVTDDPEVEKRRLFVKAKNNLAPDTKALSYMTGMRKVGVDETTKKEIWAPYVEW